MSKKITLRIVNRNFNVDVDEDFAPFLESKIFKDFNTEGNNDIISLLQAYVRTNYDIFTKEQEIEEILKKVDKV